MAITFTRPKDLPAASDVTGGASVPVDNGTDVEKATPKQIVDAGRPIASESQAIAGTDNDVAMTPLTTRQAIDNDTSGVVAQAQSAADRAEAAAEDYRNGIAATYGILPGNTPAQNDAAFLTVPAGQAVDLGGATIPASAVPDSFHAFNGFVQVGSDIVPMPEKRLAHPFDGQWMATDRGQGAVYHTGPVWWQEDGNRLWRVVSAGESHAPTFGMPVTVEVSEDMGQTWRQSSMRYADKDRKVRGLTGGVMGNGRFGLIIAVDDGAYPRDLLFFYSDDGGDTWQGGSPITGFTYPHHFPFDQLHKYPASVGGHDETGWFFIAYRDGGAFIIKTTDNGATWAEELIYVNGSAGAIEMTIARVGNEDKWVGWLRENNGQNFLCFTSTGLTKATTTVVDSGIPNIGGGGVGTPPKAVYAWGKIYLYLPYREGWSPTGAKEQRLNYFGQDARSLFDAGGVFDAPAPMPVANWPARALGMIFHTQTQSGFYAHARAGETEHLTPAYEPGSNYLISMATMPRVAASVSLSDKSPAPNLCRNADFYLWEKPGPLPYSTREHPCEGWGLVPSGITWDSIERVEIDPVISRNFPHRPLFGMKMTASTGNDYAGFDQRHHGKAELLARADRELCVTLYGTGLLPDDSKWRVGMQFFYDGSPDITVYGNWQGLKSSATGGWSASARILSPTMAGKTIGAGAYARLFFDCGSSTAPWDGPVFCGVKEEFGPRPTPMMPVDRAADLAACRAHTKFIRKAFGMAYRSTDTLSIAPLQFAAMVKAPSVTLAGSVSDILIDKVGGGISATGFSTVGVTESSAELRIDHAVNTTFEVARIVSTDNDTYVRATVEF